MTAPLFPACEPSRTGPQSAPLSPPGYCLVGDPTNFLATGSNPILYSWSCVINTGFSPLPPAANCSASYTPPSVNPYSACVVGNPAADCSTNTYVDQAACLAANPAGSGRTCYQNDIAACNATRVTQCPVAPVNPYSACVVGNPAADCGTNTYATQAACLAANPAGSGRTCYQNDILACNATRVAQCPAASSLC